MLFMVIERFRDPRLVRERFAAKGRMVPDDVTYRGSWIDPVRGWCYQLMEAAGRADLQPWIDAWSDIVEFDVIGVETSADYWARFGA